MFLAVTARRRGWSAPIISPTTRRCRCKSIVADVNLDMPILTYTFEDMIVFGAERSTLGPIVAQAVGAIGVGLSPDPMPEQGIFVRSDHFRFVQKGVPSVFLWPGQKGPGKAAVDDFIANHYHKPVATIWRSRSLWARACASSTSNYAIAREIADGDGSGRCGTRAIISARSTRGRWRR